MMTVGCGGGSSAPKVGTYHGTNSQGKPVQLVVAPGGKQLSYLGVQGKFACGSYSGETNNPAEAQAPVPLKNGAFSADLTLGTESDLSITSFHVTGSNNGSAFTGTMTISDKQNVGSGATCTVGKVSWKAKWSSASTTSPSAP